MMTPPPSIQAAIAAACAAEDERQQQGRVQKQHVQAKAAGTHAQTYKEAYHHALALARRAGRTITFRYNEMVCFAAPDDQWLYA